MGKGRRHNSRAGRPRPTRDSPEVQALIKERDAWKWLFILAAKELPDNTLKISSAELSTRLALQLFEPIMGLLPEGGAEVFLKHGTEISEAFKTEGSATKNPYETPIEEFDAEEWSQNRVALLAEGKEVVIGDLRE